MDKTDFQKSLQAKIDTKTKPLGALGKLEKLAFQIGNIQGTLQPKLTKPTLVVFAADHGAAKAGISAYPQEVTAQMVLNFMRGGAAINVFAKQNNIELKIVNAGVNYDFESSENLIHASMGKGTANFLEGEAMSERAAQEAMDKGASIVEKIFQSGCNVIGFGEMGIGNTSSAALLMHIFTEIPLNECIGRGTGLDDQGFRNKIHMLRKAVQMHGKNHSVESALAAYGGFEIAMICGAILKAYELKMILLIDGFIVGSAFLAAMELNPDVIQNAIFCHTSAEQGHIKMLEFLQAEAILDLGMRLGEGTGCAMAYPIIQSAVNFLNEMASFESAGVSSKNEG